MGSRWVDRHPGRPPFIKEDGGRVRYEMIVRLADWSKGQLVIWVFDGDDPENTKTGAFVAGNAVEHLRREDKRSGGGKAT